MHALNRGLALPTSLMSTRASALQLLNFTCTSTGETNDWLMRRQVQHCHDFRRSPSLSLFGRRLAVDVTGLLAIASDLLFIFHLFCLCLYTPGFNPPITCSLFNPLFPHVCLWVIVYCIAVRYVWPWIYLTCIVLLLSKIAYITHICCPAPDSSTPATHRRITSTSWQTTMTPISARQHPNRTKLEIEVENKKTKTVTLLILDISSRRTKAMQGDSVTPNDLYTLNDWYGCCVEATVPPSWHSPIIVK